MLPRDNDLSFGPKRPEDILAKILARKQRRQSTIGFRQLLVHLFVEQVAGAAPHSRDVPVTAHRNNRIIDEYLRRRSSFSFRTEIVFARILRPGTIVGGGYR